MFQILALACGLTQLVCAIIVLIKMFSDSILKGVIGLICGIYAFIWGWMHSDEVGGKVMLIWTLALVGQVAFTVLARS